MSARALVNIEELNRLQAAKTRADAQGYTKTDEYGATEQIASMTRARIPVQAAENKLLSRRSAVDAAMRLQKLIKSRPKGTTIKDALAAAPENRFNDRKQVHATPTACDS